MRAEELRRLSVIFGAPVREVPPDWVGPGYLPTVDEEERPIVQWWALHPDGRFTPVFTRARPF